MTRAERREAAEEWRHARVNERLELGKAALKVNAAYRCECGRLLYYGRPEHPCTKCGRPRRAS